MKTVTPLRKTSIFETVKKKAAPGILTLATLASPIANDSFTNRADGQEAAKIRTVSTTANPEPNYQRLDFSHLNLEDSSNPIIQKERIDSILRSFNQQRPKLLTEDEEILSSFKNTLFHRITGVIDEKGNLKKSRLFKITDFLQRLDAAYQQGLINSNHINNFIVSPNPMVISNGLSKIGGIRNLNTERFISDLINLANTPKAITPSEAIKSVTDLITRYENSRHLP